MRGKPYEDFVRTAVSGVGVGALSRVSGARAERYVVARDRYRPFEGLPEWLAPRTDDDALVANIGSLERQVWEHKVFDIHEPALLEHRRGYAFLRSGLVRQSMTYWKTNTGPTPKAYGDYLLWLLDRDAITSLPEAVSLRAPWEGNFWHFQNNALRKLIAVDQLGLADDVPLLVGKPVWESRLFVEARTLPAYRTRNWVLHDRPVRTDRLVIALEGSYRRTNMVAAHETLELRSPSEPPTNTGSSPSALPRDLFVVADQPENERHLDNEHDVARHLAAHGFAPFHAEALSLDDRIRTIRAASCLVLPGGAGVASLVHRIGMPTSVVEVVPSDKELVEPYAAWFCREFGFSYRAVVGSAVSSRGNFTVDVEAVVARRRSGPRGRRSASAGIGQRRAVTPTIAMSGQEITRLTIHSPSSSTAAPPAVSPSVDQFGVAAPAPLLPAWRSTPPASARSPSVRSVTAGRSASGGGRRPSAVEIAFASATDGFRSPRSRRLRFDGDVPASLASCAWVRRRCSRRSRTSSRHCSYRASR